MLLNLNVPVNHLEILFDGDSDLVGLLEAGASAFQTSSQR